MKILVIGQTSIHWGRLEFGNIGNYYIIEPLFRELHRVFPNAEIKTTLQMSKKFCEKEKVEVVPIDYYYSFSDNNLERTLLEFGSSSIYSTTKLLPLETNFIREVKNSDLVIDFSGDIWGDNADSIGQDRFLVGLCKDRVSQLLGKPTAMIAGSPGPFNKQKYVEFAKKVYEHFDLVTNRESVSTKILQKYGFDCSKTYSLACPAFLFEPTEIDFPSLMAKENIPSDNSPVVGFILCGWNFTEGSFDKENRKDSEFMNFVEVIEHIIKKTRSKVILMSHSNGFPIPPKPFKLLHGRDYPIIKQLQKILIKRGNERVFCLDGIYDPWATKAIISNFDMLLSGRVHGAVAGVSQYVPTVFIDYGNGPKAHKIRGFAEVVGAEEYVVDPHSVENMIKTTDKCWRNRYSYEKYLKKQIPYVKYSAHKNFDLLKKIV